MQLPRINNQLKPLTLALGLASLTSVFSYADVDDVSKIINSEKTIRYIESVDNNEDVYYSNKYRFGLHLQRWERKTMFVSSAAQIVGDEDFQAIVAMGKAAVPFIKEELQRKPSTLVWALNYIFNQKISNRLDLKVSDACKLWIKAL